MSQAVRRALVGRMEGDAALVALLGKDPNDGTSPAIFNTNKNQAPLVYDCVTFRLQSAVPDARFRPALPKTDISNTGGAAVEDFYLEAEAWTDQPDSAPIEAIGARLDALFENAAFPTQEGRVFKSECVLAETDLYDKDLNAWYGLWRFRLRHERTV